jgi:GTPase SAR1 family protein
LIVAGASGVGKTTLVEALAARQLPGVQCHYFDSIGVPTPAEMEQRHGGGEAWQANATRQWIGILAAATPPGTVAVLDGQVRPSVVRRALAEYPALVAEIILIDCSHAERDRRLRTIRGQPDLATARMAEWAAYLRGQADALDLAVIDTTSIPASEATTLIERRVVDLLERGAR